MRQIGITESSAQAQYTETQKANFSGAMRSDRILRSATRCAECAVEKMELEKTLVGRNLRQAAGGAVRRQ